MQGEMTRTYEELCEAGRLAVGSGDAASWLIGDLACEIVTTYSEHTLADFAREIGKPKGTVYEARQMSGFWDPSARAEICDEYPNLTRSHLRKCLPLKDIALARFALDKCSTRGWTVDQFGYILKRYRHMTGITPRPTPRASAPEPLATFEAQARKGITNAYVWMAPDDAKTLEDVCRAHPGARITVSVWEA